MSNFMSHTLIARLITVNKLVGFGTREGRCQDFVLAHRVFDRCVRAVGGWSPVRAGSVAPVSAGGPRCGRPSLGGSITTPVQVHCGKAPLLVAELCWAVVLVRQFTCDLRETVTIDADHRGETACGIGYLSRPQRREFSDLKADLR